MSGLCVFLPMPIFSDLVFAVQFYKMSTGRYPRRCAGHRQITDSFGHTYTKDNATKGKFSFITENQDQFAVCFNSTSSMGNGRVPQQLVKLNMKHGMEAKNYKVIEKVEKLTPLEAQLRHLEHLAQSIADDFDYLKKRGKEMRDTNASTNTRVLFFGIISTRCLSALATWQVFYLRRFFKAKKLID